MAKSDLQIGDQVSFDGLVGRVVALGAQASVAIARGPTHEVPYSKLTLRKRRKHRKTPSKATKQARAVTGTKVTVRKTPKTGIKPLELEGPKRGSNLGFKKVRLGPLPKKKTTEALPLLDLGIPDWKPSPKAKKRKLKTLAKKKSQMPRGSHDLSEVFLTAFVEAKAKGLDDSSAADIAKRTAEGTKKQEAKSKPRKGKRRIPKQGAPAKPRDKGSQGWSNYIRERWPLYYLTSASQKAQYDALSLAEAESFIDYFERNQRSTLEAATAASSFSYAMGKKSSPVKRRVSASQQRAHRLSLIAESAEAMQNPPTRNLVRHPYGSGTARTSISEIERRAKKKKLSGDDKHYLSLLFDGLTPSDALRIMSRVNSRDRRRKRTPDKISQRMEQILWSRNPQKKTRRRRRKRK